MLINKSEVKKLALHFGKNRAHKLTRVSKPFLEQMDSRLREIIQRHIEGCPSVGKTIFGLILCLGLYSGQPAFAHPINMKILAEIESSNNPKAYNKKSGARGLYQITPIVLKQFSESQGEIFTMDAMYEPKMAAFVANWYLDWLSQRCDTVDEILIAWNWGIGNLRKWKTRNDQLVYGSDEEKKRVTFEYLSLPKETSDFLKKYHKLVDSI